MEQENYQRALKRARDLRGFYTDLVTYLAINVLLLVINLVVTPNVLWFYWVTIFWGIALLLHALSVFSITNKYLGKEWEERKAKEIMEKEQRRKAG